MPYKYLKQGRKYGLKNKRTGEVIWYDPKKVSSMQKLKKMARIREAYAHDWKPKKRGLAAASKKTRQRVARMGGKTKSK